MDEQVRRYLDAAEELYNPAYRTTRPADGTIPRGVYYPTPWKSFYISKNDGTTMEVVRVSESEWHWVRPETNEIGVRMWKDGLIRRLEDKWQELWGHQ